MPRASDIQLSPLRTPPLKQQVINELTRLLRGGALAPGDRIPTERELSEQLVVSRGTVREAVQFLQALGVLEIRHGSGTYVARSASRTQDLRREWRRWTRNHAGRVHELLEIRQGIESFAAELAAARVAGTAVDKAALESMREALAAMDEGDPADVPSLVRADIFFHRGLCRASGNSALVELVDVLGSELVRERAASFAIDGRLERSCAEHRAIYEAVTEGRPAESRAAVLAHLRSVQLDIERSLLAADGPSTRERGEKS
jgi:GntR family transcriptional repressor for pyruvate dehydrogenase complex